jgi:hypothetical protein
MLRATERKKEEEEKKNFSSKISAQIIAQLFVVISLR